MELGKPRRLPRGTSEWAREPQWDKQEMSPQWSGKPGQRQIEDGGETPFGLQHLCRQIAAWSMRELHGIPNTKPGKTAAFQQPMPAESPEMNS